MILKRFFIRLVTCTSIAILPFISLCTTDEPEQINTPESTPPVITLSQPLNGVTTTISDTVLKYQLRGTITLSSGTTLDTFTIDGNSYIDSVSTSPKVFAVTFTIVKDTSIFILSVTDNKKKTGADTVIIIRNKPVIAQNEAILNGTMYRPSTASTAKRLAKLSVATNAAGQQAQTSAVIPLSGADILLYDADSLGTSSVASVKTDSLGRWKATVKPGNYFIFAVWFDQQNLELITASIENVKATAGKADTTSEKIALKDDIPPILISVLDADAADDKNTFLANNLASGLPVVLTFSEPMNRLSAGDDTTGIILGEINPSDENVTILKKIAVNKLWSATGKELRLIPKDSLTVGKYYKITIPSTTKDLALNKIGNTYYGIFSAIAKTELVPFDVKGATVKSGDTIAPSKTIEIAFSRPVDGLSLRKNSTLIPYRNFFFEAKGNLVRLCFPADSGLVNNSAYTLTIDSKTKDLLGDTLKSSFTLTFKTVAQIDTSSSSGSIKAKAIAFVSSTLEAYMAMDIERFAQSFHPQLEVIDIYKKDTIEKTEIKNLESFLQNMRNDASIQKRMAIEGVYFPKIYRKIIGTDTLDFRKLIGKTGIGTAPSGSFCFIQDVGNSGFSQPRVLDSAGIDISTRVIYRGDTLFIENKGYIINIPQGMAFITTDVDQRDPNYYGRLQNSKTNIEMQLITITTKHSYNVRAVDTSGLLTTSKSIDVLFDLTTTEQMSNSSTPMTRVQAIKMTIINENGRLLVRTIISRQLFEGTNELFKQNQTTILKNQNFSLDSMKVTGTKGIELLFPPQKAVTVAVPVVFKWNKVAGVKGYLIGISNEISGGTSGLLVFTNDTSITIASNGAVTGGSVLTIDPSTFNVPLPKFTTRLTSFDTTKVFVWKVVGIADSTASSLTNQLNIIADSDFRPAAQPGYFTLATIFPNISNMTTTQTTITNNEVSDSDRDGFPDWIEKVLGTRPFDAASKPELLIDSDNDGIADFFESGFGTNPEDSLSKLIDANVNHIPDTLEKLSTWDLRLAKDSDNDKWPDEIEILLNTDPWNQASLPKTYSKGAAPVGSYIGKFLVQADNKEFNVAFTIGIDSLGKAYVVLDSTSLEIVRPGEKVALSFMYGEWVFYYKMTAGLNVSKFLKFRANARYQEIEGNVDMSDQLNGGGPLVGRFKARTDGQVISLLNNSSTTNPPQTTGVTLPPIDVINLFSNPPTDAKPAVLQFSKDSTSGKLFVKMKIADKEITSADVVWQPQTFPMYIVKFATDSGEIRIEGGLFKDAGGVYLSGPFFKKNIQQFMLAVKSTTATPENPIGSWNGYARNTQATTPTTTTGPLAFIGTRATVDSAVKSTGRKALSLVDSTTFYIKEYWMEGVIWKCKDSLSQTVYQIIEKPNDPQNVFIGTSKDGSSCVVVRPEGGIQQPENLVPFTKDLGAVKTAVQLAGNVVKTIIPNSTFFGETTVNIASIRKVQRNGPDSVIVANSQADSTKVFVFMAVQTSMLLKLIDNKPLVSEMQTTQSGFKTVTYYGAKDPIITALNASANKVLAIGDSGRQFDASVNSTTLISLVDSLNQGKTLYRIKDAMDSTIGYVFLADSATGMLVINNNRPVVRKISIIVQSQSRLVPFTGNQSVINTALAAGLNIVKVMQPNSAVMNEVSVNPSSLISVVTQNTSVFIYKIKGASDTLTYVFMADSASGLLKVLDNKPIVNIDNMQIQPVKKMVPFTGIVSAIQTALTSSLNAVKVIIKDNSVMHDAVVNATTITPFTDPGKPGVTIYKVRDNADTLKTYIFMADSASGTLILVDNKPVVSQYIQNQVMIQIYRGTIGKVDSALVVSQETTMEINPATGALSMVGVLRSTIKIINDSATTGQTIVYGVTTEAAPRTVLFTAVPNSPLTLNMDPATTRPIVIAKK
jgi:Bacterial Ig-like domain